jgi:DNA-binding NtrC family response regulator
MSSRSFIAADKATFERHWSDGGRHTTGGYERSAVILTSDEHASERVPPMLAECCFEPICLDSVGELRTGALDKRAALILCEDVLPDGDFRDVLRVLAATARKIPVIVFSRFADWDSYLRAVRLGAYDCMRYPFRSGELEWILRQIIWTPRTKA